MFDGLRNQATLPITSSLLGMARTILRDGAIPMRNHAVVIFHQTIIGKAQIGITP